STGASVRSGTSHQAPRIHSLGSTSLMRRSSASDTDIQRESAAGKHHRLVQLADRGLSSEVGARYQGPIAAIDKRGDRSVCDGHVDCEGHGMTGELFLYLFLGFMVGYIILRYCVEPG